MEIALTLCLPRDELSVPVARRIVEASMRSIGVDDGSVNDVAIALSEAATNVLKHAGTGEEYAVSFHLANEVCTITVKDLVEGFDVRTLPTIAAGPDAEQGRGVTLMRALVDEVHFESDPADGTVVRLRKTLDYGDGLLSRSLSTSPA